MVGYAHNNPKIEPQQEPIEAEKFVNDPPNLKKSNASLDQSFLEIEDSPDSFFDSLLNFDAWVEDPSNLSVAEVMNSEAKSNSENLGKSPEIEIEREEVCGPGKLEDLGCLIQEGMGKVCLSSSVDVIAGVEETEVAGDGVESGEVENGTEKSGVAGDVVDAVGGGDVEESEDSEEEASSSSSASESSSSDDSDDEDNDDDDDVVKGVKKVKGEVEMEEGEIRDLEVEQMVSWSDDEDGDGVKGPIRSKNEVQDLPPVPPVTVTIEPHHQTLPVGVVLSIMGAQVVVEGVENHNPLSEGSILWITESRSPLGVVDEIFGPVKNPYYIVRYNSESEVPTGIQQGSLISFVPEFADYVLNNNNLYKKGYDASGENDEELADELEFSDDEKEAEYKRMLKMSKRGSSEQKNGHMKKDKKSRNRGGNWKNEHRASPTSQGNGFAGRPTGGPGMSPAFSPGPQAPNLTGPGMSQAFSPIPQAPNLTGPGMSQAFSPVPQAPNLTGPSSGVWPNGLPCIPPQNTGFPPNGFPSIPPQNMGFPPNGFPSLPPQNMGFPPNGFSPNGLPPNGFPPNGFSPNGPFMQQNFTQQAFQNLALPQLGLYHPQFNPTGQMFPSNFVHGVPQNFGPNPAFASWPADMSQNSHSHSQSQVGPQMASMYVRPQEVAVANGPQMENNGGSWPPAANGPQMVNNGGSWPPVANGPQMENNGGLRPPVAKGSQMENSGGSRPPVANGFPNRGGGGRSRGSRGGGGGGRFRGGRGGRNGQQSR